MSANEKIFRSECGEAMVAHDVEFDMPDSEDGWRERSDDAREYVIWVTGYGWMTPEESSKERQRDPRMAP
ncbi:MAG: hypothetical protein WC030_03220 [Candidatus Paceibacterota bacterium]